MRSRRRFAASFALALALALASTLLGGCYPFGRTITPKSGDTECFLEPTGLCVKLTNVETEGNCNFEVIVRASGVDVTQSTHVRVNERARVPLSYLGRRYELEVANTIEHIVSSDEAIFVLHGPL
jgi:hypothetical protein